MSGDVLVVNPDSENPTEYNIVSVEPVFGAEDEAADA